MKELAFAFLDSLLKYLGYAVVLAIYGALVWTDKAPVAGYITVLVGILAALGAKHSSESGAKRRALERQAEKKPATASDQPKAPTNPESGRIVPSLLISLAMAAILGGCAGLSVQWVASYSTTDLATILKMPAAIAAPGPDAPPAPAK